MREPPCSNALQDALLHAGRLRTELARLEREGSPRNGQEWLVGRSQRVEATLSDIIFDWRAKKKGEDETLALVLEYLVELHGTVRKLFGAGVFRHCCLEPLAANEPQGAAPRRAGGT
jgi:hypothetical protein